jgi:hypothetical protein
MVTTPTVDEVQRGYNGNPVDEGDLSSDSNTSPPFSDPSTEAEQQIVEAVDMFEAVFSDQLLFTAETLDEDNAIRLLCRHKWALTLGDTIQSEGQAGTSVTYNVSTRTERSLSRTSYGLEFLEYLRDEPNISVYRGR